MLSYDLGPPRPLQRKRAIHTGSRKTEGGRPFRMGKEVGGPKSYDSTETLVLYTVYSLYSHPNIRVPLSPPPPQSSVLASPAVISEFGTYPPFGFFYPPRLDLCASFRILRSFVEARHPCLYAVWTKLYDQVDIFPILYSSPRPQCVLA
jgi:hypothetical protein